MTKKAPLLIFMIMLISANVFAQQWMKNLNEAETKASSEDKNILLVFSGSDWCVPCMKLEKFIWQSDEFKSFSEDHYVLLRADFMKQKKNKLSREQEAYNKQLAEKYNPNGYFPFVVILNENGEVLGHTGYKNIPPKKYIEELLALEK